MSEPYSTNGAATDYADLTDNEMERRFLGASIIQPSVAVVVAEVLEYRDFFREAHRYIYRAVSAVAATGLWSEEEGGLAAVAKELREGDRLDVVGGFSFLADLASNAEPLDNVTAAAEHLAALATRRRWVQDAGRIATLAYETPDRERLNGRIAAILDHRLNRTEGPPQPTVAQVPSKHRIYSAVELAAMELPPVRQIVPGLYGVGHYLLSGAPKMGKSILAMSLATSLAAGTYALGSIAVEPRPVLYLSLEDGLRRTVTRLKERLGGIGGVAPEFLQIAFEWPSLDAGGLEMLRAWSDDHPGGVFFVDTGKRLRQGEEESGSFYSNDYDFIAPLTDLTHEFDTFGMTVWHDRKLLATDFFDQVNASRGLTAAVDGVSQLQRDRGSKEAKLSIGDRDSEDRAFTLRLDDMTAMWVLVERVDVANGKGSPAVRVLAAIRRLDSDLGVSPDMVVAEVGDMTISTVRNHFTELSKQGAIRRVARGRVRPAIEDETPE